MSPLENAIEVLENKNQQLRTLISQCQTRQMQNINPLTMCLNGVIDAAVNGGVARYQEVSSVFLMGIFNNPLYCCWVWFFLYSCILLLSVSTSCSVAIVCSRYK